MKQSRHTKNLIRLRGYHEHPPALPACEPSGGYWGLRFGSELFAGICVALTVALSMPARSQSPALPVDSSSTMDSTRSVELYGPYLSPTRRTKANNYLFSAFGPYPIAGSAIVAGINQASDAPPEWSQGIEGYSKRVASNYGIAMVATTTRFGLSEAFKEDDMYYRCGCTGLFPRVRHALFSTLTARRGDDGHRVFSIPALVGPYAGTIAATYGWYPSRYGYKDAFRTGNYSLLVYAGQNLSLEFIYSGPHSLLARMHLTNLHGAPIEGPNK